MKRRVAQDPPLVESAHAICDRVYSGAATDQDLQILQLIAEDLDVPWVSEVDALELCDAIMARVAVPQKRAKRVVSEDKEEPDVYSLYAGEPIGMYHLPAELLRSIWENVLQQEATLGASVPSLVAKYKGVTKWIDPYVYDAATRMGSAVVELPQPYIVTTEPVVPEPSMCSRFVTRGQADCGGDDISLDFSTTSTPDEIIEEARFDDDWKPETVVWRCPCMVVVYPISDPQVLELYTARAYYNPKGYYTAAEVIATIAAFYLKPFTTQEADQITNAMRAMWESDRRRLSFAAFFERRFQSASRSEATGSYDALMGGNLPRYSGVENQRVTGIDHAEDGFLLVTLGQ